MRRHAHSLKGACGYISSEKLKASALALQLACEAMSKSDSPSSDTTELSAAFETVLVGIDEVNEEIEKHLASVR